MISLFRYDNYIVKRQRGNYYKLYGAYIKKLKFLAVQAYILMYRILQKRHPVLAVHIIYHKVFYLNPLCSCTVTGIGGAEYSYFKPPAHESS